MKQKILAPLRSPRRLLGAAIIGLGLMLLVAAGTGALSDSRPSAAQPQSAASGTPDSSLTNSTPEATPAPAAAQEQTAKPSPQKQTNAAQTQGANNNPASSTEPAQPTQRTTIAVSLTVNNTHKGTVNVPENSNQCDVLQQALTDGIISSLQMRWNAQYGTYGVYVIDGIGDDKNVWWGYKVNGKSPPVGCSGTQARSGDTVNWTYAK